MTTKKNNSVAIERLTKKFGDLEIFENFNLTVEQGSFVCLLGPNGCGKSTLLKTISGLTDAEGKISLNSENIGFVGQDADKMLLPWLSVKQNVIFPKQKKDAQANIVDNLLESASLKNFEDSYPYQLSGGMQQMVLLCRALLNESKILLLDEPFKSLDFKVSRKFQQMILDSWIKNKFTILMISHDIEEAMMMADEIIILSQKPTKVKQIINITLPRPRNSLINTSEFQKIKRGITNAFLA